jgi:hypothetical protein
MRITLTKFIIAKWESDDPVTDGFQTRVFASISGSSEKETNPVWKNGGGR